ncbi:hypothetical protein [Cetobacterium sp.]|uniref:hypothetical protein n=1 Tax=Cetobacterium sp. TaxID=2071632 RepID=UPI003F2CE18C
MIYVLGAALGASVVYGLINKKLLKEEENNCKHWLKENLKKDDKILELQGLIKDYEKQIEGKDKKLQLANSTLGNNLERIKKLTTSLENREGQIGFADITIKNLETKVNDLKEQLKLEDEASCKIIKELEDMVAELERENKLKDDKIAYEIGEKKNYIGYIDYVINAPRAVRRRFANGEKVDWIDENGVLRMRMVEEK